MSSGTLRSDATPEVDLSDRRETVPERVTERILGRVPLDRVAMPEDVAGVVRFVAGDAGYMTGQVLAVNGGMEW